MEINFDRYLDYNAAAPPPAMREIIFLKGTPYEMGRQYGSQAKNMIKRNFCIVASDALKNYSKEEIVQRVKALTADLPVRTPEIHQFYKGIADGAGMSQGDIALINVQLWMSIPYLMCSTIGAKGNATADGKLIAGVNGDVTYNMSGYGVTLVAFPDEGNAFVTLPQLAGQMGSNFAMNEKGLIITFDGGESECEGDKTFGYADFISAMVYVAWKSDAAQEAADRLRALKVAGGWIYLLGDSSGTLMVNEHTYRMDAFRYPGDHGEKDFINAANHFVDEKMRISSIPFEGNKDSYYRYDTERKLLEDGLGSLTLEKMMEILACRDAFIDGKWREAMWGVESSNYSPEMSSPDFRTGTRCFGIAEDKTAYILHGTSDRFNSYIPGSTGKFCKIPLAADMNSVVFAMEDDAVVEVWKAAKRLHEADSVAVQQEEKMDKSREYIWAGKNHGAKAAILEACGRNEEARIEKGCAASCFSYAYITAQMI